MIYGPFDLIKPFFQTCYKSIGLIYYDTGRKGNDTER